MQSAVLLLICVLCTFASCSGQRQFPCDKPRNAAQPFCDSTISFDARLASLIASLTLDEKIGLMDHNWRGASANVDLDEYNWWNEALHGVAWSPGTNFRPPTDFATAFPQIISLASSFNKGLFAEVGNATGNEARVFGNVGTGGLTFWSPNINIYRDPRWGRGHETPGEDPLLNSVYGQLFIEGLQGNERAEGFLKTSACAKHFAAHSLETDRFSFNSVVTKQDMADTYLPAFKTAVEDAKVSCVMCAYNAINGVPACGNGDLLTRTLRESWGFDGYVVSDCYAVSWLQYEHHYTNTTADTCHTVLDAGLDLECGNMFEYDENLKNAVTSGAVPVQMLDTALTKSLRVLMRVGFFEKEASRPYKELTPSLVDSEPHKALALQAARESIVLLKNAPNPRRARAGGMTLPIDPSEVKTGTHGRARRVGMALIGPYVHAQTVYLGNYYGRPSSIRTPWEGFRAYTTDSDWAHGCDVTGWDDSQIQAAVDLAASSSQVVLFVGLNADEMELEEVDRDNLTLPGLQTQLVRRVLDVVSEPIILFLVSGGGVDVSEWETDPRVGAIIWAGYLGQSAGEAMADVVFGNYNPSGRLTQTFYHNEYVNQIEAGDMNMRPGGASPSPGRTYRFFTGQPLYPFGFGLSYTNFDYAFLDLPPNEECPTPATRVGLTVGNSGSRPGDNSVLWFLVPPGAGQQGRPIKSLLDFEKLRGVQAGESRVVEICLRRDDFQLADAEGEFGVVTGKWLLVVGNLERSITVV